MTESTERTEGPASAWPLAEAMWGIALFVIGGGVLLFVDEAEGQRMVKELE